MKQSCVKKIFYSLFLFIFLVAVIRIDKYDLNIDVNNSINLKNSGFWPNLNPIHIDDNWSLTVSNDWCDYANGFYIIENVVININGMGSGITIENSEDNFILKNCTIFNSGGGSYDSGILINNTKNGIVYQNILHDNYWGLNVRYSSNLTISDNEVNNNYGFGINLYESSNNTVNNNQANNNYNYGLFLSFHCRNNNIIENDFKFNDEPFDGGHGIYMTADCTDSKILHNTLEGNNNGIHLRHDCNNNLIEQNTIINNKKYGACISNITSTGPQDNNFTKNWFDNPSGMNAYDNGTNPNWDVNGLGNYWSDYTGSDTNGDCIGEEAYSIASSHTDIQDDFPLMACWFDSGTNDDSGKIWGYDSIIIISIIGILSVSIVIGIKRKFSIK